MAQHVSSGQAVLDAILKFTFGRRAALCTWADRVDVWDWPIFVDFAKSRGETAAVNKAGALTFVTRQVPDLTDLPIQEKVLDDLQRDQLLKDLPTSEINLVIGESKLSVLYAMSTFTSLSYGDKDRVVDMEAKLRYERFDPGFILTKLFQCPRSCRADLMTSPYSR